MNCILEHNRETLFKIKFFEKEKYSKNKKKIKK